VGSPKGREPYGDTGTVVVVRVTPHRGGREGRPQGKGCQVAGYPDAERVCEMQSAETVLGVLRERGRRGLPLNELYRQLFNPQLYLLAYGNIYSSKGAMTPGPDGETADGCRGARSAASSMRCATSVTGSSPCGGSTSRKRTGRKGPWGCRRRRHSAVEPNDRLGFVVVTHPFHPLSGQRLEVLFAKRRDDGVVFVCAGGIYGSVTLPQAWTDRGEPPLAHRLSAEGLAAAGTLVRSMGGR
jgi:Family of unknown function (DUF5372)